MKRLLVLSACLLMAFAFTTPTLKLEYKFKANDRYDYRQVTKQTVKQTLPGMGEMNIDIQLDATMQFMVVEKTSSGARMEATYTKLKMDTSHPMMKLTMDSESTDNTKQNQLIKAMMNKPFYFTFSKTGEVKDVENVDNIYSGLNSVVLDSAAVEAVKKSLQETISAETIETSLEMGLAMYPETKVKAGDTWKTSTDLAMNYFLHAENVWTLKKIEGPIASIEMEGTLHTADKERITTLPNGLRSKSDFTGRHSLAGKVDVASGWPAEIKTLSQIKGNLKFLAGGMIPEDMDVPTEMVIESTFTITRK